MSKIVNKVVFVLSIMAGFNCYYFCLHDNKKTANFCLCGGSGLPMLQTRMLTVISASASAFLCSIEEIVQISTYKEKRKRLFMSLIYLTVCFLIIFVSLTRQIYKTFKYQQIFSEIS